MKKLLVLLITSLLVTGCSSNSNSTTTEDNGSNSCSTLSVMNWGEYASPDFLSNFENENEVTIKYSMFASNEEMHTKLLGGAKYDVIIATDYMLDLLIQEDRVQKLNHDLIPNMSNLNSGLTNPIYDEGLNYTIPYFWGNVGIVYDKTIFAQEDVERLGFGIFHDEKYADESIVLYDSPLDSFMMALKDLGYSARTTDTKELDEAYEWLLKANDTYDAQFMQDEVIDALIYGQVSLSNIYSGVAAYAMSENENLAYYTPESGTVTWNDSMVITKDSECVDMAHKFINYALDYDAALENSTYVGYTSSVEDVMNTLSAEDGYYYGNEAYTPRVNYELDEYYTNDVDVKGYISELWIKLKAQ